MSIRRWKMKLAVALLCLATLELACCLFKSEDRSSDIQVFMLMEAYAGTRNYPPVVTFFQRLGMTDRQVVALCEGMERIVPKK